MMQRSHPDLPGTLPDALSRAAKHFHGRGIVVFDGRGRRHERRSWAEVEAGARRAAGQWAACGVQPGDRVLVVLPTSFEWLDAWLGAALLGAYPVAVAPGAGLGPGEAVLRKVEALVELLGARRVLAKESFRRAAVERGHGPVPRRCAEATLTPDELFGMSPAVFDGPTPEPQDDAFLQLTSGSTGLPRAVRISHRSLIHNARAIDDAIGTPSGAWRGDGSKGAAARVWAESLVSWLPLHHDMGLVGCLFVAMLSGLDLWLLQPQTFLARPKLWLEHLAGHGNSFAHAPNFGYQLCLERLEPSELEGLDLSPWRYAMTGAEMVRPETVAGFCERFGRLGFAPEAIRPCYGLAEATLAVTLDTAGRGLRTRTLPGKAEGVLDPELQEVACVGSPVADSLVRIVDRAGNPLADGTIGEVRAAGPGIFGGYWNDPEATAETLVEGSLPGEKELRTGDLGFLHDGELYISGRTKDLLIVRGHNFMPHEIEWLAENVTGGGGAARSGAFSITRGSQGEEAVVVVESSENDADRLTAMARDIRVEVSEGLGLVLADVRFVRRGRIPKTTSGKVQRRALRDLYLENRLD